MGANHRNCIVDIVIFVVIGTLSFTACTAVPTTAPLTAAPPPQVTFIELPTTLCQAATQIRLEPQVTGIWSDDAKTTWELTAVEDKTNLNQGEWQPAMGELLAPFPDGKALPAGEYRLDLRLDGDALAEYTFIIGDETTTVTAMSLAMSPDGPELTKLADDVQHFYVRYTYQGACLGAPYWIVVYYEDNIICNHSATLGQTSGTEAIACYSDGGAPLHQGTYRAELTMMDQTQHDLTFEVGEPPVTPTPTATATVTPSPTPRPQLACDPLFTAAGLTADGEPFLPQDRFEWYSQVIYAGARCRNLMHDTAWATQWYRNGTLVHSLDGVWQGPSEGVVWDSITGQPRAPFLPPGTYTVTLTLNSIAPLTAEFRLIAYVKPENTP